MTREHNQSRANNPASEDGLGFEPYVNAVEEYLTQEAKPLTVSVEGEWGAGKTSFMKQLKERLRPSQTKRRRAADLPCTVWFNAWRNETEETMWSSFAVHFVDELRKQTPLWKLPAWELLKLRFDWKRGWFPALLTVVHLGAWLLVAIAAAWILWELDPSTSYWEPFWDLKTWVVGGGAVAAATTFLRRGLKVLGNPLRYDLKKHVRDLNHADRVAFVERFHEDFGRIVKAYAGDHSVFVFIDDLDRCDPPKAAELMQALNLMLPDEDDGPMLKLYYILGIDRDKVAAGLAVKFRELLPFLASGDRADSRMGEG